MICSSFWKFSGFSIENPENFEIVEYTFFKKIGIIDEKYNKKQKNKVVGIFQKRLDKNNQMKLSQKIWKNNLR